MAPFFHAQKFLVHKMLGSSGAACCKRRNLLLSTRWCHLLPLSIIYHSVLAQIRTEDVRSLKLKSKRREQEHGWNGWETGKEKLLLLSLRFTFRCRSAQTLHQRKLNSFNSRKGKACANCLLLVRVSFEWCGKRDTASCFTFLYWSAQNCLCSGPLARISSDVDLFKRSSRYRAGADAWFLIFAQRLGEDKFSFSSKRLSWFHAIRNQRGESKIAWERCKKGTVEWVGWNTFKRACLNACHWLVDWRVINWIKSVTSCWCPICT